MGKTNWIILLTTLVCLTDASDWGYAGESGPLNWKDLFPEACSGRAQSPININTAQTVYKPDLKDIVVFYDPPAPGSKFYVHNNGHSIQVNTEGKFFVSNGGLPNIYSTAQFHFHWGHKSHHGSEHTVDNVAAPIEMHIVNWNSDKFGSIAEAATEPLGLSVLGILFEVTEADNPALEPLVRVLTNVRDPDMKIKAEIPAQSMRAFLPRYPERYYRYDGSLTTPGCFESVVWTVFQQKQTISRRQLAVFRQVLKPKKHHNRNKRSKHRDAQIVEGILAELGIQDDITQQTRFKRNLEEKKATEVTVERIIEEEIKMAENMTGNSQPEPSHAPKPVQINAHGPGYNVEHTNTQVTVQHMLVNNFRPVQPLNGRTVYRSFPFFEDPVQNTKIVYIERDGENGALSTMMQASVMTLICSLLAFQAFQR